MPRAQAPPWPRGPGCAGPRSGASSRVCGRPVLELGCGLGAVGVRLARLAHYVAAEPDERSFAIARARITRRAARSSTAITPRCPAGGFDLVCAFEVLEHIEDDAAAAAAWLRPGPAGRSPAALGAGRPTPLRPRRRAGRPLPPVHRDGLRSRLTPVLAAPSVGASLRLAAGLPAGDRPQHGGPPAQDTAADTTAERTAGSGRLLQPQSPVLGTAIRLAVAPFGVLQRCGPGPAPGSSCGRGSRVAAAAVSPAGTGRSGRRAARARR